MSPGKQRTSHPEYVTYPVIPPVEVLNMWYRVHYGDTLSNIAYRAYGNAADWTYIYAANVGRVYNPNLIYAGQWLYLPA
jgi:nucleoid-associated protein YgaU